MNIITSLLTTIIFAAAIEMDACAQELFRIYQAGGKQIPLRKMLQSLKNHDVVLFGELHGNNVAHRLELQVLKQMSGYGSHLILGMEMLEADDQLAIDEYLSDMITEKQFRKDVRLWDNYTSDYAPMVEFAKSKDIPLIATNIPGRYANLVYRKGPAALESLAGEARQFMAPLPISFDLSLPGYAEMIRNMGGHGSGSAENLAYAQAVRDATMAHFILKNLKGKCLHINGSYHSMNREGIVWYLLRERPTLKILTIHTAESDDIRKPEKEDLKKADFLIMTTKDVTNGE